MHGEGYGMWLDEGLVLDARQHGNTMRFCNHSNVKQQLVRYRPTDVEKPTTVGRTPTGDGTGPNDRLDLMLRAVGKTRTPVPADGHCFFSCVRKALAQRNRILTIQEIRAHTCDRLAVRMATYDTVTADLLLLAGTNISQEEYYRGMRSSEWADDPAISAVSLWLGCAIRIWDTHSGASHLVENEGRNDQYTIEVAWVNTAGAGPLNHFEWVTPLSAGVGRPAAVPERPVTRSTSASAPRGIASRATSAAAFRAPSPAQPQPATAAPPQSRKRPCPPAAPAPDLPSRRAQRREPLAPALPTRSKESHEHLRTLRMMWQPSWTGWIRTDPPTCQENQ
mmetsp:Transcript_61031/g.125859  ORF Transcript_61031/g.125859 Transcript_61031/m.125859 type:complete len:336 (-) Transcript_61031:962-1969(-)